MNKPLINHQQSLIKIKQQLEAFGFTTNQDDVLYYIDMGRNCYHLELYRESELITRIKSAHAEDETNNQFIRYLGQIDDLICTPESLLFVCSGNGWKYPKAKRVRSKLNALLGKSNVIDIDQLNAWLVAVIEKDSL